MADYEGSKGYLDSWEETYRSVPARELPWNAGGPDSDLKRLLEARPSLGGRAWDLGCGPGNDSLYLAAQGWEVEAVDIAPTAVELARAQARSAGLDRRMRFRVADVLGLEAQGTADLVHDRGCFHVLPSRRWAEYRRVAAGLLHPGGLLVLKVFSHEEPAGGAPYRFRPEELEGIFSEAFEVEELRPGIFEGPRRPRCLFCVLKAK